MARVPPTFGCRAVDFAGMTTWVAGPGASLSCCCERLSHVDPDYLIGDCLPTSANVLSSVAVASDER